MKSLNKNIQQKQRKFHWQCRPKHSTFRHGTIPAIHETTVIYSYTKKQILLKYAHMLPSKARQKHV